MLPGRRRGAVVSYIRRAFCLDCRVASALLLRTVRGSLDPLPSRALRAVGGELAGADTSCASCLQPWCTWVRAPTPESSLAPSSLAPSSLAPSSLAASSLAASSLAPSSLAPSSLAPSSLAPSSLVPRRLD